MLKINGELYFSKIINDSERESLMDELKNMGYSIELINTRGEYNLPFVKILKQDENERLKNEILTIKTDINDSYIVKHFDYKTSYLKNVLIKTILMNVLIKTILMH